LTWVAIFVSLHCSSCAPEKVGEFGSEVQCLRWVAHAEHKFPWYKGKCEEQKRAALSN